jgi:hypothetical protein
MSPTIGLPPRRAEGILDDSRASRYKGGTLIAEEVCDVHEHLLRLSDPDRYRPSCCARCGHDKVHVHDRVERRPRGDPSLPPAIEVLVFCCASQSCGATWRILPRFLARHLWYAWRAVESLVKPTAPAAASALEPTEPASERTQGRWRSRLSSSGQRLRALLVIAGGVLGELALAAPPVCTREQVLDAFLGHVQPEPGGRLSAFAAVLHRLERGARLM